MDIDTAGGGPRIPQTTCIMHLEIIEGRYWPALAGTLLLTVTLADSAAAQQSCSGGSAVEHLRVYGATQNSELGFSVASAGDVDGDGVPDVVAGAPGTKEVHVYSGATGAQLLRIHGRSGDYDFGEVVDGGKDVDGDGIPDVLVGTPRAMAGSVVTGQGAVSVHSGATGSLIHRFEGSTRNERLGTSVVLLESVDGDRYADFAASGDFTGGGEVHVWSGRDGSEIHTLSSGILADDFGTAMARTADVNGDNVNDLLVGAPSDGPFGNQDPTVYHYSGRTGQLLRTYQLLGYDHKGLGRAVAGVEDVDGDGVPDVILGAAYSRTLDGQVVEGGRVFVVSAATGAVLHEFEGTERRRNLGQSVAGVGDMDGDGVPEILAGAPAVQQAWEFSPGYANLYSGASGVLLNQLKGAGDGDWMGTCVAEAGDLDGDGTPDVLVGAPRTNQVTANRGVFVVYTYDPFIQPIASELSAAAGGRVDFQLDFPDSEAGRAYSLRGSASAGPWHTVDYCLPLTPDALTLRMLTDPPPYFSNLDGVLGTGGTATVTLDVPAGSGALGSLVGTRLWFMAFTHDPGPVLRQYSIAVAVDVVP